MSRKLVAGAVALICMAAWTAPVLAQDGRFRLERTERGLVRMDTQTGVLELCVESGSGLDCKPAQAAQGQADTRTVDSLRARIDQLEKRITALEERSGSPAQALPSDGDFERTLGFMERFMRRFIGIAKDLESEQKEPTPGPTPTPNRT